MVCPNCGNSLSEDVLFCRNCGVRISDAQKTAPPGEKPRTAAAEPAPAAKRHIRRALVSLLLFVIFTCAMALSGRFAYHVWQEYRAPYETAAFAALEEAMARRENCSDKIANLETRLKENARETRKLETALARCRARREKELLDTVTDSGELDLDALFETEFFYSAYMQYIDDLLRAFTRDPLVESWLRSYYDYSVDYGANTRIKQDLQIYDSDKADEPFSELLDPGYFCASVYTAALSDHLARNGHLYVTGLDILNTFFEIPGYVLDDAVFVKAFGGSPSPAEMEVPGWSLQDYKDFWETADSRSDSSAIWEDLGLSSADFELDWNRLVDESAYYRAYEEFMDAIAPGLARYDPAQYVPDDDYYGGFRYELSGEEASPEEIAAAYIGAHPECLSELGINREALPSSYDEEIAETKLQLEKLAEAAGALTQEKSETEWLRDTEPFVRQQQETLLAMEQRHKTLLSRSLLTFILICLFMLFMAACSLRRFIRDLA